MKIDLITNNEIRELRDKTAKTECETLVHKLHSSYNAVKIFANEQKRKNEELLGYEKENEKLRKNASDDRCRISYLTSEVARYKRMLEKGGGTKECQNPKEL